MKKPIRILIVEDKAADADLAEYEIRKALMDCEFQVVETRESFLRALETFQPDVILSDYTLPGFDGTKALKLALERAPLTPFIVWTGSISEDVAVDCVKAGANNYILKDNLKRLGPAVIRALEERELLVARKQAEEALQNSERRFRALIENGLDDISLLAADGALLWESPSTIRNLGYTPNEFVGRNIFELMHPEDMEWTQRTYQKVLQEPGSRQRGMFRLRRSDGVWRWMEAIATNMLHEPSVNAIVINYRDITEQKQAEIELQQRNADLALINALNETINRGENLDTVVSLLRNELRRIFSSEYTNIYLLDQKEQTLKLHQSSIPQQVTGKIEKLIGRSIPTIEIPVQEDGLFQNVLRSGRGMVTRDEKVLQRWIGEFVETASLPALAKATIRKLLPKIYKVLNIKSTILVPLISDGQVLGVMNVSGSNLFTEEDLKRVENICGQLTIALRRKQVEESLQESQARYENLVETSHDLIWAVDSEGQFTFVNQASKEIYGYEPEELLGRPYFEILDPSHSPASLENFRKTLAHVNELRDIETHVRHRDGKQTILSANSIVLRDENGNITGVVGSSHDITARKHVEDLLKEERNLLRTLIDNIPDRIYAMDSEGRKTLANTADWKASGGKTMEDVVGKTDFDTYPPELAEEFWKLDKLVINSGQPLINYEEPGLDADGNQVSILTTKIPLHDDEGNVIGLVGIGRDITERKQTEERLNDLLEFNEKILNHSPLGIITYKFTGECVFANENAAVIAGTTVEQLKSYNFHALDSWRKSGFYDLVQEAMTTRLPVTADIHHVSIFGKEVWMTVYCVAFKSKEEDHVLISMTDITERKRAEAERQALFEIMQGLANTKDLQELLQLVHRSIAKVIYAGNFFVVLHHENNGLFEEIYSIDQYDPPEPPSKLEHSITSYVFRTGNPLLLTQDSFDTLAAQGEIKLIGTNSASWLGVPLKTSGRTIGVMAVQDYENDNRYTEHEKDFLASIATQVALVIERKRAEESLNRSEALYRQAIEVAGAVPYYQSYYDHGKSIKYEFIGEGIRQITGYGPEEFNAKLWDSLVEEINLVEDLEGYSIEEAILRVRMGQNSIWKCEHLLRDRQGNLHWVFEAAVELRDEHGVSYGSIGTYQDITERKRAEQALRESEEHYRTIFEGVQDAIFVESLDGKILMVNQRACEMFGFSQAEFLTKTVADIVPPGSPILIADNSELSLSTAPREAFNRRANGEIFPIEISGRIQIINGEKVLLVVVRDITERKQSEDLLRESEERFSSAFEYASIGMALVAPDGHWLRVNWALSELLGYSEQELMEKTFQDITHPDDLESDLKFTHQLLAGEIHSYQLEKRYYHRLGYIIWALLSVSLVRDHEGKPLYLIAQIQDITERKRVEESLREERRKAEKYLEIAGVMMLALDREGTVTLINQKGCEILGYPANEIIGKNWINTFLPEETQGDLQDFFRTLISDESPSVEYYENSILTKNGEKRLIAWHNTLLRDEQGTIISTLSSGEDITERKRAEAELRASEERFRQLADNIQEAFWMTDAETNSELYMSPAVESIWGSPIQRLMSEPNAFMNSVFPEDRPAVMRAIEKEKAGEKIQLEYRITRPDGSLRWIWDRAFPILDAAGKVKRIAGISADITERKEAAEKLRESEDRYHSLFQNQLHGTALHEIITDENGTPVDYIFLKVNPAFEKMTGLTAQEIVGRRVTEVIPGIENERLIPIYGQVALSGEPAHLNEYFAPLGRYFEINAYHTGPLRFAVSFVDVTERRQAEQELRKLSRAVEQSGSTILITDILGNIEYVNPKFTQTTGYTAEEAIGQNPRILKSGLSVDDEYKQLWQTISSGREWHGELLNRKKDGTLYWESVTISPIMNERGEITHFVGVKEDITERKQNELETRRHIAELEAVYENGLSVGRLLEPTEIGNRVIETFARYLPWHHVTIRLRKEDSDDLELVAFNLPNLKEEEIQSTEQHFVALINKVGQGLSGWVIQTGIPFRTGNVHQHSQYIDTHSGIQSGLYMPLRIGERVIGVISVESEAPDAFTEQDERLLATLANQTAIAFENAHLYEAMQKELSERQRVEDALRISETHYRALADSITDILFELDQDLHYTHWNKASEALTGISAQEAIGKPMEAIFGINEEQSRIKKIYEDVLQTQRPKTFETILVFHGEKRSFEVNAYPSMRGVSVVAKDVTERKRTEIIMQKRFELMEFSARHSLGELMQRAVDEVSELTASPIGFFNSMDEDQNKLGMQTWSTNALKLFQVSPEDGTHLPLDQAGVWAEAVRQRRPLLQNDYASLGNKKSLPTGHVPVLREMVIPIIRNERIMAVMGIGNKPQAYTLYDLEIAARLADYAWDITERKQMEIALELERNQLVERVEERTADLSRANSNLARALRVKDEFLANMSHELRTPLNAILGLSESLGEQIAGPLNEKQQKYISTISESGHHLLSLINDILDLAKIEAGQITMDINKVDIHGVCQASLRMVKQLAQKKSQEVSLQIDNGLGLMWADERRLKQMIVNLLGNAVKFTPENGKLGLEVHGDEEANQISITVWDNGIGIKEDDLQRLFQPFVQLDSGLAREATGTGLGLALVAQMARLHGGSVNATSEAGSGSRFTIILPWEPALAMDAASRMRITGKFRAIKFDETNKPTILLVEDTKEVVMMLKDYLELTGYRVFTAQDGIDGIVQARHVKPDLILMDIQMPRMDGFETTRKLRSDPNFRYTPIIALTALAMPHDRERCLEAGMDEYISKPVNLKALIKIIQNCLFEQESNTR